MRKMANPKISPTKQIVVSETKSLHDYKPMDIARFDFCDEAHV